MPTTPMHKMPFPIETPNAYKFWASRHVCNRVKAIISFSLDREDAMHNLRRFGFPYHFRARAWNAWQHFVARPDMDNIPFTPLGVPWWECIPNEVQPGKGSWVLWDDSTEWIDSNEWIEWIDEPNP